MNWSEELDSFGRNLLSHLDVNPGYLPTDRNPITEALKSRDLVAELSRQSWFNQNTCRTKMSRAAAACQMIVYDANGGPDGDGKPKGLRRQWYSWYKTAFAQPLSRQLGDEEFGDQGWNGRMSQTYGKLVDGGATYRDLWVDDASRMMAQNWETLFRGCHIVVAVEKDSLFSDFQAAGKALGAKTLVSGKGKQSKAATEKMLREHFGWRSDFNPFDEEHPLIVLHITDHDMDGEAVIGPTFGEQARRYTDYILEARVGIKPEAIEQAKWPEKWYEVKTTNSGYIRWAEGKGLFLVECECGYRWPTESVSIECPRCGRRDTLAIKIGDLVANRPHGFEVEALPTRVYYSMLVDALLQVLPFEYIIGRLRDECQADADSAARELTSGVLAENESYQALLREFDRLEAIKAGFEEKAREAFRLLGEPHVADWRDDDEDPLPEEFSDYVKEASDWSSPWRPFKGSDRTASLVEWLGENATDTVKELSAEVIEW